MYKRWQEENIKSALTKRRVVILAGARQCGKTTLSKTIFKNYRTLDDFALYDAAKNDPKLFVKNPSMSRDYFKHLKWFKEHLAKEKKFIGIVLYTGEHVIEFYENMFAVPMNNLWE